MEDQPVDPGDLTTDAEQPATESAKPRRRWRLRRSPAHDDRYDDTIVDLEETTTEVSTEATEVPTEATEQSTDPDSAKPVAKKRRRSPWGRAKPSEPQADSVTAEADEAQEGEETKAAQVAAEGTGTAEPSPPKPVGKRRRRGQPAEQPEEPKAEESKADEPANEAEGKPDQPETEQPADDRVLVPHRPAGKRLWIAATVASVLFVGSAGFAGATLQPYLAERATIDTKLDVARTAADAISTLWTYTPDNMESLPDRAAAYLGGDFAEEYRKYIDAIVAPNKQAQVTNTTQVMGAAVETLTPTEATAIVYTNSVATSPVTKNIPSLRYLSYRLTMRRDHTKWLITRMSTVTSFDLTPQL